MKVGLLGGTFDPVHLGHLGVAAAARDALALDAVWLMPARTPPHRTPPRASAAHRFAMTALAVADTPHLLVSDCDMEADGPSYTETTLERLHRAGWRASELFFITGADAFAEIGSWKAYPAVLDRCHFVVVSRPGTPVASLRERLPALALRMKDAPCDVTGELGIFLVDAPTPAVSSTGVRQAVAAGHPLTSLVPSSVAAYIARQQLYLPPGARASDSKGAA
jgi:nicotinate-nucleotide adenylyltransferase